MNCKQFTGVSDDSIYKAQEYWQQYKNVSQLEDNLSAKKLRFTEVILHMKVSENNSAQMMSGHEGRFNFGRRQQQQPEGDNYQVYEDLDASTNPSTHIAAHPVPRDTPWEPRASDMSMDESFDGDEEDIDEEAPVEETLPTQQDLPGVPIQLQSDAQMFHFMDEF